MLDKMPLTMEFKPRTGNRYLIWNGTHKGEPDEQLLQFPSHEVIYDLWKQYCPEKDFFIGSVIDKPMVAFYAEVGPGTKPKQREAFCAALHDQCVVVS